MTYFMRREQAFFPIYIGLVLIAVIVNFPGRLNPDTVSMMWQAANPTQLNTWHAPFATFVLSFLNPAFGAPGGGLIIQSILMMLWPAIIASEVVRSRGNLSIRLIYLLGWGAVCAVFIALSGQVNKDILLLAFISSGFFLVTKEYLTPRELPTIWLLASGAIIVTSIALIRLPNLFILFVPMLVYFNILKRRRAIHVVGRILVIFIGTALAYVTIPAILGAKTSHPEIAPIMFDLVGIETVSGDRILERLIPDVAKLEPKLEQCYSAKQIDPFFWGPCAAYGSLASQNIGTVKRAWVPVILSHPVAYIRHRLAFAASLLSKDGSGNKIIVPTPPGFDLATNAAPYFSSMPAEMRTGIQIWRPYLGYVPFGRIAHIAFTSTLGSPLLWVLVAVGGVIWGLKTRAMSTERWIPFTLGSVGLCNLLMIVVLSGSDDTRYLLPTWMTALGICVFAVHRLLFYREPSA